AANLMNFLTPASLGGDVYRVIILKSDKTSYPDLIVVVLRERLVGIIGFTIFYLLCILWLTGFSVDWLNGRTDKFLLLGLGLAAFLILVLGGRSAVSSLLTRSSALINARVTRLLEKVLLAAKFDKGSNFFALLSLSLAGVTLWVFVLLVVAANVNVSLSFATIGMIGIFVELVRLIPITVQGIGVREGLFAYCFVLLNLPPEKGLLIGAIAYFVATLGLITTGIVGYLWTEMVAAIRGSRI
ncbi:MAG: lysylphosphatidylglycerol synthase domain-containing protein, partial [Rhizobiaceae bacterium]